MSVLPTPEAEDSDPVEQFRAGVLAEGGTDEIATRFVERILPCESPGQDGWPSINWTPGNADYRSAAQFHPDSWRRVEQALNDQLRFEDPMDVGRAVATWVHLIGEDSIATNAGWPVCGTR